MKKLIKWAVIIIGILILILLVAGFYFNSKYDRMAATRYDMEVSAINIPSDSLSLERGRSLAVGCRGCHGVDYAGLGFFDDKALGYMASPNLTGSKGSATENYTDLDWVKALKHGLNPEGRPLMVMPSEMLCYLSDQDLGSLIAYLKSVPEIEKPMGETHFTTMARVMMGAGMFGELYGYNKIPHDEVQHIASIDVTNTMDYGKYMTEIHGCQSCHGENFNGGLSPDPISPPGINLTPKGNIGNWTSDQFIQTLRTGKTPEAKILDNTFMPWAGIGAHDSIEIAALYSYLKALPPMEDDPLIAKQLKKMEKK
jgi:cytochrome c553